MRICLHCASIVLLTGAGVGVSSSAGSSVTASAVVRADPETGRLVRHVIAPVAGTRPEVIRQRASIDRLVAAAAAKYDVDPLLVHSVIRAESNYNPFAVSPKGAQGLMQLIPATARRFGVSNSFDARENIDAGVRYLKHLQEVFGDERLALAAYNAGEGSVEKNGWAVPPYPETQEYVRRVRETYRQLQHQAGSGPEAESRYRPLEAFVDAEGRLHLRTR